MTQIWIRAVIIGAVSLLIMSWMLLRSSELDSVFLPYAENMDEILVVEERKSTVAPITQKKQTAVIIVTFMRSGSTFLGEMFNVHDDAFYMFEPLHPWSKTGCAESTKVERVKFVTEMLSCNFTDRYNTSSPTERKQMANLTMQLLDERGSSACNS